MQSKEDDLKSLPQHQDDGTTHATVHATVQVPAKDEVQYITKGIFTIAYDKVNYFSSSSFSPTSLISDFGRLKTASGPVFRYLDDLRRLSQWHTLELYLWMVGKMIAPSFSLYFGSLVILNVDALWRDENTRDEIFKDIQFEIMAWMLCGIMSYQLDVAMIRLRGELGGRVRYEFIPKLVEAAFQWDINNIRESWGHLPDPYDYGSHVPGWENFVNISSRVTSFFVVVLEMVSMVVIMACFKDKFDVYMMFTLIASFLVATFLLPKNGAGGAGYTYWTKNEGYHESMRNFNTIFKEDTRSSILKDGLNEFATQEYKRASTNLGVVTTDTYILDWHVLPAWYWGLTRYLVLHYPMAVCALFGFLSSSRTTMITMIIFQYGVFTMTDSIQTLEAEGTTGSLLDNMKGIGKFYTDIDKTQLPQRGLNFPTESTSTGMKVELDDVSFSYGQRSDSVNAIQKTTLSIQPGQLIVIAGKNGSGKTTLAKLIAGHIQPTSGKVVVDGNNLKDLNSIQVRQATIFLGNSEVIYPISLRDNLLYGLTSKASMDSIKDGDLDKAAEQGGAKDLIDKYHYETIFHPCSITAYSLKHEPGQGAYNAFQREGPKTMQINVSPGEHQRIVASRAFMRLNHGNIKLIILDEPGNALDPTAEHRVFDNFREIARRERKTMIVVTHRLSTIAKHADLVLCMDQGAIGESGTHDQLIATSGLYAELFKASLELTEGEQLDE